MATISKKGILQATHKENLFCGQTSHLTNFSLLQQGNDAKEPCQTGSDNSLAWASLGMVAGAANLVILSVLAVELQFRWRQQQLDIYLTKTATSTMAPSDEPEDHVSIFC